MGQNTATVLVEAPLSRRERRKLEVRTRILDAAMLLFEERGMAETTVAEICERADVAHKTFFNHFPSKQHLLRDIAIAFVGRLVDRIDEAARRRGSTANKIAFFFDQVAEETAASGPTHRNLITEIIHIAHQMGTETEQARQLHEAFGILITDGIAAGDVSTKHSVETITEMVLGAFYVLMFDWAYLDDYPLAARAKAAAKFLGEAISKKD
jgi:AcrR family transcriptional regulator